MLINLHTHGMFYSVDIQGLVRRGTSGAFAGDPTVPYRPSRLLLLRRNLRVRRMLGNGQPSSGCAPAGRCVTDQRAG
jgi:hypothetical protein